MKKRMFERGLSLLLALVMVLALAPVFTIDTKAADTTVNSLAELKSALASGGRIVVGKSFGITENLTIPGNVTLVVPSGVELVIPYDASNTKVNAADAINAKTPAYSYANATELDSTSALKHPGNSVAVYLVTMESGAVIEVSGVLAVGGEYSSKGGGLSGQTAGRFSQIHMEDATVIDVKNGGVLSAVGYVTGTGSVKLASGAKAYEPFVIGDYQGGTYVVAAFHGAHSDGIPSNDKIVTENSVMPFNSYSLINIQSTIEMQSGSNLMGYCDLFTNKIEKWGFTIVPAQHNKTIVSLVGPENSIFNLTSGYAVLNYAAPANGINDQILGQTEMDIYGDCTFGSLALSVTVVGTTFKVSSAKVFFTLPYSFKIVQKSHSLIVPVGIKVKMLPGSEVYIEEGASLTISKYRLDYGSLITYDGLDNSVNNPDYPSSKQLANAGYSQRASLIVDGTMKVDGAFGGVVETRGNGVVSVDSKAVLSLDSFEGVEKGWGATVMGQSATVGYTNRTKHSQAAQLVMHSNKYTEASNSVNMVAGMTYHAVSAEPVQKDTTYSYVFDPSSANTAKTGKYSGEVALQGTWAETTDVIYDNGESLSYTAPVAAAGEILTWYADHTFTETVAAPAASGVVYYSMEKCEHEGCKYVGIDAVNHGYTCAACGLEVLEEHDWVDGSCTVCGFGQFNVDAETDRVVMIDAPAHSFAVAAAYDGEKMVLVGMNDNGSTSFVLDGLESGMNVKIFLLDADYAPIADYVPVEKTAE